MSNKFKGEVSVKVEDQDYKLVLDWNALAEFETMTGKNAMDVLEKAGPKNPISFSDSRAMVLAALQRNHPDATLSDAGDILSEDMTLLARLVQAASPAEEGNGKAATVKKLPPLR